MAALQKIRSKAGLLIGVLAVALLAFIFPWNELTSFINKQRDKAFTVDGEVISTGAYLTRVNDFENFQKMMSGQSSFDENASAQIKEYVYQQMLKEIMLDKQAEDLGLAVSDEEKQDMIVGTNISPILRQIPLFTDQQTRQFSPEALNQFLSYVNTDINTIPLAQADQRAQLQQLQSIWATIQNLIKYQRLEEKYNGLLSNAIQTNKLEKSSTQEANKTVADIAYVVSKYSALSDTTVTVTDNDIKKIYAERKNNFKNPEELRKITYFSKEITPSENDFAAIEKEINTAREKLETTTNPGLVVADYSEIPYQDIYFSEQNLSPEELVFAKNASIGDIDGPIRQGDIYRLYKLVDKTLAPDSVNLKMIIVPQGMDPVASNTKADSIINIIKGGKDFATVANEILPQSNGGEIGWITETQLGSSGKELIDATFYAPIGQITKLNLQGAIQIVKVEAKTNPVPKYKLALVQMTVPVSDQTMAALDNELNEFVVQNGENKKFEKAALEKGYNLIRNELISGSMPTLGQISGSRQVITWAFHEEKGTIKKFDLADYKIIAQINEEIKPGYLPISEVEEILKEEAINEKKAEKLIADLISKKVNSLAEYADIIGTKVDTIKFVTFNTPNIMGLGRETTLNVYAELGKVGEIAGPVKGDNGVFVLKVLDKQAQTDSNKNLNTAQAEMSKQQMMYRVISQANEALKQKMNVKDNRVKFF